MNRHLIYQSYQAMLSLMWVQCNCQNLWQQYVYKSIAVLFQLRRTNVKFKNGASAKYQVLELDNLTAH